MTARENQGLQAALIVFVVLTIALSVATFVFFSKYDEERSKIAQADQAARTAEAKTAAAVEELQQIKVILGVEAADSLKTIEQAREKDFQALPVGIANENPSYRDLAKQLAATLAERDRDLIDGKGREITLGDKISADTATKEGEIDKYETDLNTATTSYLVEREKLKRDVDRAAKSKLAAQEQIERRQGEFDRKVSDLRSQVQELEADGRRLLLVNGQLFERINDEAPDFEVVDANVQWVSQRERRVWINKGSADGLRSQVTFKVFDRDDSSPTLASSKGSIEVIRVTEPHTAEAKIVEDNPRNPILTGDKLFSAVWHAGRVEHSALTGFMDLDGDGQSDRDVVKRLIALSGGVVDAEVTDEGKLVGELLVETKFLVEGSLPTDRSSARLIENHTGIKKQARYQSVKSLSIGKFLDYVGYQPQVRTVAFRRNVRAEDFRSKLPDVPRRSIGNPIDFTPIRPGPKPTTY